MKSGGGGGWEGVGIGWKGASDVGGSFSGGTYPAAVATFA